MRIKIIPTQSIRIYGIDERSIDNLAWCATSFGINRFFWIKGYLLCLEVYERSLKYEIEKGFFPISQICYTPLKKYRKIYEVQRGVEIPIVNVSDMKIYQEIIHAICKMKE